MTRFACLAAAALLLSAPGAGRAAEPPPHIRIELTPDPVGLDELATLTLRVDSRDFRIQEIGPTFDLDNLQVASGPFRSQSQSWINGATSSSVQLVWRLQPGTLGEASVRNVWVAAAGSEQRLADLSIRVVREAPPGRPPGPREPPPDPFSGIFDEDPFGLLRRPRAPATTARPKVLVRLSASPLDVYVGQQVDWRLLLDTQTDVVHSRPRDLPDFSGFVAHAVARPGADKPNWIESGGERFGRVAIEERLLDPLRAGSYSFGPIHVDVVARVAEVGWFGRLARDQPLLLRTGPATLRVRPLPVGAPLGFGGLVGDLSLAARPSADSAPAGSAVHLVVRATGPVRLQGSNPPPLDPPPGLRVFSPAAETRTEFERDRWRTHATWDYVLTADRPGTYRVPPLRLPYFDVETSSYREAASAATTLTFTPATATATAASPLPSGSAGEQAHAAPSPSTRSESAPGPTMLSRTLLASALSIVLLAGAILGGVALRRRRSTPVSRVLLDALESAGRESSARAAATAIDAAWRAFLAARFEIGHSIPASQWPRILAGRGVAENSARDLVELFDDLHLLEYAPELSDREGLRRDVETRALDLARRLR